MQIYICYLISILFVIHSSHAFDVTISINTSEERKNISPYIYGANQLLTEEENWTARRKGGNRMTGYNWENNASNAGSDWQHSSDNYLGGGDVPGKVLTDFHDKSLQMGAISIVTLQMAGYAAKDKNGTVSEGEAAPSDRWVEVVAKKNAPFDTTPDLTDNYIYMDECVNFLVTTFGSASAPTGITGFLLDNEPALWVSTHPRIHPLQPTCQEVTDKSVTLAKAIKDLDSAVEVIGPVLYGFAAYTDFQAATDWSDVSSGTNYNWFIDYYLDAMKIASDADSRRLLDVLDIHWYPEARGHPPGGSADGYRIVMDGQSDYETYRNSREVAEARVQAPRTLWNDGYIESSWIGEWGQDHLPIIPKVHGSIDTYFPDTKLAVTEFNYGGEDHISGGIAIADVLGILGKYGVDYAMYWNTESQTDYTTAAYKIYRNYDSMKSAYGSINVKAVTSDIPKSSVYASILDQDSVQLHIIAINKNFDSSMEASFSISSDTDYESYNVWAFNENSATITNISSNIPINNNSFSYSIPKLTVCHFVLKGTNTSIKKLTTLSGKNYYLTINPNNHYLDIAYFLYENGITRLGLYTINGKYVTELVKEHQLNGKHTIRVDCGRLDLSTGVYFLRLQSNSESIIKPFYILK